ncbi:hypothetical protein EJ065_6876 [Corallococcus coralloides]|uniref:Uncharacterized protein n=1 Tax=Corallococcus coralloides TaxID=184914 RepID=A0A410S309_CORCK|nr:hypothetical protein EJ065_6876 [Corallococcus coralloides]
MPKSSTLMAPESVTTMFSGFKSRWTMPCSWAHSSARTTGTISSTARAGGRRWLPSTFVSGLPCRYSSTMNGPPVNSPTS